MLNDQYEQIGDKIFGEKDTGTRFLEDNHGPKLAWTVAKVTAKTFGIKHETGINLTRRSARVLLEELESKHLEDDDEIKTYPVSKCGLLRQASRMFTRKFAKH